MAASRRSFLAPFASIKHSLRITFQAGVSEHRGCRHHDPQARAHAVVIVIDELFHTAGPSPGEAGSAPPLMPQITLRARYPSRLPVTAAACLRDNM